MWSRMWLIYHHNNNNSNSNNGTTHTTNFLDPVCAQLKDKIRTNVRFGQLYQLCDDATWLCFQLFHFLIIWSFRFCQVYKNETLLQFLKTALRTSFWLSNDGSQVRCGFDWKQIFHFFHFFFNLWHFGFRDEKIISGTVWHLGSARSSHSSPVRTFSISFCFWIFLCPSWSKNDDMYQNRMTTSTSEPC